MSALVLSWRSSRQLVRAGAALLALTLFVPTSYGQTPLVLELFRQGMQDPRGMDTVVVGNKSRFGQEFYACLSAIRPRAAALEQSSDQQCMIHTNPNWRTKCLNENPARNLALAIGDIERVTRGQTIWANTQSGAGAIMLANTIKAMMDDFDNTTYQQLRFVYGEGLANAKRQEMINIWKVIYQRQLEVVAPALICPG